ncbi:hypothetical protein V8324_16405, partial [Roseovarius sp. D22-M7]
MSETGFPSSLSLADLAGADGFRIDGADARGRSGYSVAAAGDINGDGIDDVIIGAPLEGIIGSFGFGFGASYVLFGSNDAFDPFLDLALLDGTDGFRLDSVGYAEGNGVAVSGAGDINADGFDDLIIGAPNADPAGTRNAGESYVVFGSDIRLGASLSLADLDGENGFLINGIGENDESGRSVAGAGDINGDGIDDLIIAAPGAGESYVVFGSDTQVGAAFALADLDGTNGFRLEGLEAHQLALPVADAGDINGDGIRDIIIGAPGANPGDRSGAGESYVVFGSNNLFEASIDVSELNGTNGFRLSGIDPGDRSGTSVSGGGDINGDGLDDLIIGAPDAGDSTFTESERGESYVIFGSTQAYGPSLDLADLDGIDGFRLDGVAREDNSGSSVAGAGDVNDDGIDDLMIGAQKLSNEIASYVVFGSANGFDASYNLTNLDGTNGFRIDGRNDADGQNGLSVAGAGDINDDGFDDLLIGASLAGSDSENFNSFRGESYIVFGRATPGHDDDEVDEPEDPETPVTANAAPELTPVLDGSVVDNGENILGTRNLELRLEKPWEVGERFTLGEVFQISDPDGLGDVDLAFFYDLGDQSEIEVEFNGEPISTESTITFRAGPGQTDFVAEILDLVTLTATEPGLEIDFGLNIQDQSNAFSDRWRLVLDAEPPEPASAISVDTREFATSYEAGNLVPLGDLFEYTVADDAPPVERLEIVTDEPVEISVSVAGVPQTSGPGTQFVLEHQQFENASIIMPEPSGNAFGIRLIAYDANGGSDDARGFTSTFDTPPDAPLLLNLDGTIYNLGNVRGIGDPQDGETFLDVVTFNPFDVETGAPVTDVDLNVRLFQYASTLERARNLFERAGLEEADEDLSRLLEEIEDFYDVRAKGELLVDSASALVPILFFTAPFAGVALTATILAVNYTLNERAFETSDAVEKGQFGITVGKSAFKVGFDSIKAIDDAISAGQPVTPSLIEQAEGAFVAANEAFALAGEAFRSDEAIAGGGLAEDFGFFGEAIFSPLVGGFASEAANAALDNLAFLEAATRLIVQSGTPPLDALVEAGYPSEALSLSSPQEEARLREIFEMDRTVIPSISPGAPDLTIDEETPFIRVRNPFEAASEAGVTVNVSGTNVVPDFILDGARPGVDVEASDSSVILDFRNGPDPEETFRLTLKGEVSGRLALDLFGNQLFVGFEDVAAEQLEGTATGDLLVAGTATEVFVPGLGSDDLFMQGYDVVVEGKLEQLDGDKISSPGEGFSISVDEPVTRANVLERNDEKVLVLEGANGLAEIVLEKLPDSLIGAFAIVKNDRTIELPPIVPIDAGIVAENDGEVKIDLLGDAGASDSDGGTLSVANVSVSDQNGAALVFGLTGAALTIDPTQLATALASGESALLTVAYDVTDGQGGVTPNTGQLVVDGLDGPFTWYLDGDADGFGVDDAANNQTAYAAPSGTSDLAGDADDADPTVFPGAPEINDGKDNDQDGDVDEDNTAPVVAGETYSTDDGETLTIGAAAGLLANDSDPDAADTIFVQSFTAAGNGNLSVTTDG